MIGSPVSVISSATLSGIRVPRNVPPPAGIRPRCTSGRPNVACSAATITSQPSSSSKPPATAVPLAAPTSGTVTSTFEQPIERVRDVVVAESEGVAGREGAQVHAGTERAIAGAGEHDGAYIGIAFRVDDGSADRRG